MKFSRFFILCFVLCCFGCGNHSGDNSAQPVQNKKKIKAPKEPKKAGVRYSYTFSKSSKYQFDGFRCRIGDTLLLSTAKGKMVMADSSGKSKGDLFDLHCEYMIDQMHILPMENNSWLIGWSETDHEGQKSHMAVFTGGNSKPSWIVTFPYMNIGPFAVDGDKAYFTTIGMVAKLDVDNGKMDWKIDSLFSSGKWTFNKFEAPLVYDDRVEFVDLPVPGRRDRRDTIIVDPQSGKRKK